MAGAVSDKRDLRLIHPAPTRDERKIMPNEVVGMVLFIGTEVMLFAGLISAYAVVRAGMPVEAWPPPGQPRLPVGLTAFNTLLLLASGAAMWSAGKKHTADSNALPTLLGSLGLGVAFVALQGFEWVSLIGEGLTMQAGPYGSFFYLIVGAHALHAVVALMILGVATRKLQQGQLSKDAFTALRAFWYFVVLVWPVVYWQVYL